ncbi:MAG TPA: hypothetical protein VK043_05010 [Burkholderiales bacterium]|nr:hypothetical protein [Burkholderiales bacterium]
MANLSPPTSARVPASTAAEVNARIRRRAEERIARLADATPAARAAHLRELEREWDIERTLQANAGTLALLGTALGAFVDRRFLALPLAVFAFFGQHALQGWCPPVPLFRRRGVRTRQEIERERHAVKVLRRDFDAVPARDAAVPAERVRAALAAVDR